MNRILKKMLRKVGSEYNEILYWWRPRVKSGLLIVLLIWLHPVVILLELIFEIVLVTLEWVFKLLEAGYRAVKLVIAWLVLVAVTPWSVWIGWKHWREDK